MSCGLFLDVGHMSRKLLKSRQFSCSELNQGCQALLEAKQEKMNDSELDSNIKARCVYRLLIGVDINLHVLPTRIRSTLAFHTGDGRAASPFEEKTYRGNLVFLRSQVDMSSFGHSDLCTA